MFATSSFTTVFNGAASDTGYVVLIVVGSTIAGTIALMGLGYGIRHLRKLIGGKF